MRNFTNLEDIKRANIDFLDGTHAQLEVHIIIKTTNGIPIWIVCFDMDEHEIIIPWAAVKTMTILERFERMPS